MNDSCHFKFQLSKWPDIIDRFKNRIDLSLRGQHLDVFDNNSEDVRWIEKNILDDIIRFTNQDHKVKIAVLGGLSGQNVLREHIDGFYPPREDACTWSLNIPIQNCDLCQMFWFDGEYIPTVRDDQPDLASPFVADERQHLRPNWVGKKFIKDSAFINSPTMVKINIPHKVINHSDELRVMLAVRFTPDIGK